MNPTNPHPSSSAQRTFIVGGQKSGKTSYAERLAQQWQAQHPDGAVVCIATSTAWDDEMRKRIARHQADRAAKLPNCHTIEEPLQLADAINRAIATDGGDQPTFIVIDCLTLWLTNWLMPAEPVDGTVNTNAYYTTRDAALHALENLPAHVHVAIVSNEIGLGISPMSSAVRGFVDELGLLNQAVGNVCDNVTLCVAGQPLRIK